MFHIDLDIKEDVHVLRRRTQKGSVCFLIQKHFEPFPTRLSIYGIYSHKNQCWHKKAKFTQNDQWHEVMIQ